jgi:hypothetical protein
MNVKDSFLSLGHFKLNNGGNIQFWEDKWLGNFTLRQQYPPLYAITRRRNISVASVFSMILLNIAFRRGLVGTSLILWFKLVARVVDIRPNNAKDMFIWDLLQTRLGGVWFKSVIERNGYVPDSRNGMASFYVR